MMLQNIFRTLSKKVYDWNHKDRTKLIEEECRNRWEPLFIETRFENLEECINGLVRSTNGTSSSGYFRDGIVGDVHKDGSFELTLNLPRTSRCRYVGMIKEVDSRHCIVGNVKPKKKVVIRWMVTFPIYAFGIIGIAYNGYDPASGFSLFYYILNIFVFFMIFPMILDAILKMDCRRTAKLMGENIYAQVR